RDAHPRHEIVCVWLVDSARASPNAGKAISTDQVEAVHGHLGNRAVRIVGANRALDRAGSREIVVANAAVESLREWAFVLISQTQGDGQLTSQLPVVLEIQRESSGLFRQAGIAVHKAAGGYSQQKARQSLAERGGRRVVQLAFRIGSVEIQPGNGLAEWILVLAIGSQVGPEFHVVSAAQPVEAGGKRVNIGRAESWILAPQAGKTGHGETGEDVGLRIQLRDQRRVKAEAGGVEAQAFGRGVLTKSRVAVA